VKSAHAVSAALVALAACISPRVEARAQDSYRLAIDPGTDVRFRLRADPERDVRGRVYAMAGDTLVLVSDGAVSPRYPLATLSRLEIRGGEDKRRGMLLGAGALGGIAVVFGGIDAAKGNISGGDLAGTIIGNALIGALIGYAVAPRGWVRLPLPASRQP
jgi:hypothetical protein